MRNTVVTVAPEGLITVSHVKEGVRLNDLAMGLTAGPEYDVSRVAPGLFMWTSATDTPRPINRAAVELLHRHGRTYNPPPTGTVMFTGDVEETGYGLHTDTRTALVDALIEEVTAYTSGATV